jgi:hypothetical protein
MLIEKVKTEDDIKVIYESSNILASTYNQKSKDLTIIFKRGDSYTYKNVDSKDYLRFELDESQGSALSKYIKDYSFTKNNKVDTNDIISKIKNIKDTELNSFKETILKHMEEFIKNNDVNTFNYNSLDNIFMLFNKLKELSNK